MDLAVLQKYLHDHIPLSKAMDVEVVEATDDGVTLAAPLAPNINHRETVFGGSASAVISDTRAWRRFTDTLRRKSRGRFTVRSILHCHSEKVGEFEGDFVAWILQRNGVSLGAPRGPA